MITKTDAYIYEIYKLLEHTKMLDNTAIIITADHGEMAGSHCLKQKGMPFQNSCNVPCMLISPDLSTDLIGTKCDKIVNLYDMNQTMATMGMFDDPNVDGFTGVSILSKNKNGKLIINPKIQDENLGYLNNWMLWSTFIMTSPNSTDDTVETSTDKVPQSAIYDYSSNPLEYKFCMTYYRTYLVDGHLYNYIIAWDLKKIIKTQSTGTNKVIGFNIIFNAFKEKYTLYNFTDKFCNTDIKYNIIIRDILKKEEHIDDFYTFYIQCENDIMDLDVSVENRENILLAFGFIIITFMGLFSQKITSLDDNIAQIKTQDSYLYTNEIPYTNLSYDEFVTSVENKEFNEFLYDLTDDPNEINNLLTNY